MKKFPAVLLSGFITLLGACMCFGAEPIKGDLDMNGFVEAADASMTLQYVLAGDAMAYDKTQLWAAEVDGKESVTASDASYILQKALVSTFEFEDNTPFKPDDPQDPDTSDGVVVSSFSDLQSEINKGTAKIYIKGTIECSSQITLDSAGIEFYGLTNDDGTGACLDFAKFRDKRESKGESGTGIYIKGYDYNFKNLIIQNAGDCGVRIKGADAGGCVFENCVFRYNNNSGLSVTSGGHDNDFINCDSYRNGDIVQNSGGDADGYSVKLAAGAGNYFYNCRAWENSDDGWDLFDRGTPIPDVTFIECLSWHNGNPDTFTGEYDYNNGYPLDKNLIYVQAILKQDPDFETKYNAHTIDKWPQVTMYLLGTSNNYSKLYANWDGNPNGFKFGSSNSVPSEYRLIKNCIAFDHYGNGGKEVQWRAKGFDQNSDNGSSGIHFDMENILSFNNVENIQMVKMNADSIKGVVWSFENCPDPNGTMYPDEPSAGMEITVPENKDELKAKVYAYRQMIYDKVYNDIIPGEQICDVFPK